MLLIDELHHRHSPLLCQFISLQWSNVWQNYHIIFYTPVALKSVQCNRYVRKLLNFSAQNFMEWADPVDTLFLTSIWVVEPQYNSHVCVLPRLSYNNSHSYVFWRGYDNKRHLSANPHHYGFSNIHGKCKQLYYISSILLGCAVTCRNGMGV